MADQLLQDISQPPSGANLPRGYWLYATNNYTPFKVKADGRMFVPDSSQNDAGKIFEVGSNGLPEWKSRRFDTFASGQLVGANEDLTKYSFILVKVTISITSIDVNNHNRTNTGTGSVILLPEANYSAHARAAAYDTFWVERWQYRDVSAAINSTNTGLATTGGYNAAPYYGVY